MIEERLKELRNNKGITQEQMAKILEVSRGHYGMWEIGKETIPLKKLNFLSNHFNICMDYLIGQNKTYSGNGIHELNAKEIGLRLTKLRKDNDISQKELANFLCTTQSTVSAYESGKTLILTDFAIKIAKNFNISLDYLCCRTDEEKIINKKSK